MVAIGGDGNVAHVDTGADFCNDFEVVEVVLGDPAIAGTEVNVAAIGAVFGAAVQGVAAGEAVDGFHAVAVKQGYVVIADFHDQKQVHHVGVISRFVRERACRVGQQMAGGNFVFAPYGLLCRWLKNIFSQGGHGFGVQCVGKAKHLGGWPAVTNGVFSLVFFQAREILWQ